MQTLITKTRIKNIQKQPVFLRWLTRGGTMLQPGQEVIVDGLYPSQVDKAVYLSQCIYDIASGRVEAELITNIPVRKPNTKELNAVPAAIVKMPAETPVEQKPVTMESTAKKVDERWSRGGIEEMKPPAKVLPGHEDTLVTAGVPQDTTEIFASGPSVTTPRLPDNGSPLVLDTPVDSSQENAPAVAEQTAPRRRKQSSQ